MLMKQALMMRDTHSLFLAQNIKRIASRVSKDLFNNQSLEANDFLSSFCQRKFSFLDRKKSLCVLINHKAEIIYLNQYGCELLDVDQRYIFGTCWMTNFILPEQRTEMLLVFEQILMGHGEEYSEYFNEIHTPDASVLPFQWNNAVIRNNKNKVTGIFSIGHDQRM